MRFAHIFNRGVDKRQIFLSEGDYLRFMFSLWLVNLEKSFRPSRLLDILDQGSQIDLKILLESFGERLLDVAVFCLMPNHYHLLLGFEEGAKVAAFMQRLNDAHAKYFNVRNERTGRLFESPFKAVEVKSDEQLKHLSRYIHVNPLEGSLPQYPFSSLPLYLGQNLKFDFGKKMKLSLELSDICNPGEVLGCFSDPDRYWEFCQAEIRSRESEKVLNPEMLLD